MRGEFLAAERAFCGLLVGARVGVDLDAQRPNAPLLLAKLGGLRGLARVLRLAGLRSPLVLRMLFIVLHIFLVGHFL